MNVRVGVLLVLLVSSATAAPVVVWSVPDVGFIAEEVRIPVFIQDSETRPMPGVVLDVMVLDAGYAEVSATVTEIGEGRYEVAFTPPVDAEPGGWVVALYGQPPHEAVFAAVTVNIRAPVFQVTIEAFQDDVQDTHAVAVARLLEQWQHANETMAGFLEGVEWLEANLTTRIGAFEADMQGEAEASFQEAFQVWSSMSEDHNVTEDQWLALWDSYTVDWNVPVADLEVQLAGFEAFMVDVIASGGWQSTLEDAWDVQHAEARGLWNQFWGGDGVPFLGDIGDVVEISAGDTHSLALMSSGEVYAWGRGDVGQLGDGSTTQTQRTPVRVHGGEQGGAFLADVVAVAAGAGDILGSHSLAVTSSGDVYAWGRGSFGQLGDGGTTDRLTPVRVHGGEQGGSFLVDVVAVAAGRSHSLAVTESGEVFAWGRGSIGQLGDGTLSSTQTTPVQVHGGEQGGSFLVDVVAVSAGRAHSLAVTGSGSAYAWGAGANGRLGDGTTSGSQKEPVQVHGGEQGFSVLLNVVAVSAGAAHSLAMSSNEVFAWGFGSNGQRGDGSTTTTQSTPVRVHRGEQFGPGSFISGMVSVSAGDRHSLAMAGSGEVYAWGQGSLGRLGDGGTSDQVEPVRVHGGEQGGSFLADVVAVSAGGGHSLAATGSGSAYAWGRGDDGQLGDGSTSTSQSTPVQVHSGVPPDVNQAQWDALWLEYVADEGAAVDALNVALAGFLAHLTNVAINGDFRDYVEAALDAGVVDPRELMEAFWGHVNATHVDRDAEFQAYRDDYNTTTAAFVQAVAEWAANATASITEFNATLQAHIQAQFDAARVDWNAFYVDHNVTEDQWLALWDSYTVDWNGTVAELEGQLTGFQAYLADAVLSGTFQSTLEAAWDTRHAEARSLWNAYWSNHNVTRAEWDALWSLYLTDDADTQAALNVALAGFLAYLTDVAINGDFRDHIEAALDGYAVDAGALMEAFWRHVNATHADRDAEFQAYRDDYNTTTASATAKIQALQDNVTLRLAQARADVSQLANTTSDARHALMQAYWQDHNDTHDAWTATWGVYVQDQATTDAQAAYEGLQAQVQLNVLAARDDLETTLGQRHAEAQATWNAFWADQNLTADEWIAHWLTYANVSDAPHDDLSEQLAGFLDYLADQVIAGNFEDETAAALDQAYDDARTAWMQFWATHNVTYQDYVSTWDALEADEIPKYAAFTGQLQAFNESTAEFLTQARLTYYAYSDAAYENRSQHLDELHADLQEQFNGTEAYILSFWESLNQTLQVQANLIEAHRIDIEARLQTASDERLSHYADALSDLEAATLSTQAAMQSDHNETRGGIDTYNASIQAWNVSLQDSATHLAWNLTANLDAIAAHAGNLTATIEGLGVEDRAAITAFQDDLAATWVQWHEDYQAFRDDNPLDPWGVQTLVEGEHPRTESSVSHAAAQRHVKARFVQDALAEGIVWAIGVEVIANRGPIDDMEPENFGRGVAVSVVSTLAAILILAVAAFAIAAGIRFVRARRTATRAQAAAAPMGERA